MTVAFLFSIQIYIQIYIYKVWILTWNSKKLQKRVSHSNLRSFMMSAKHVGALVHLKFGTNFKMYGEKMFSMGIRALIGNLY